ncbi:hypothetical protein NMH_1020 [Neisseria meningitidis H44/76]|uniref:Uncharacterized protein n=1 Tax=Neisseria meningitidis serogroup B / serotype 15 (strain H44/76) TaxID=909420 RepID=E6MWI0_NEIMH|nr:hypothetical protein NMH_1020 [Neisseria meningitidis H44/76]
MTDSTATARNPSISGLYRTACINIAPVCPVILKMPSERAFRRHRFQ